MKELGDNKVLFKNGVVAKRIKNGQLRILPSNQWGGVNIKKNIKYLKKIRKQRGGVPNKSKLNPNDRRRMSNRKSVKQNTAKSISGIVPKKQAVRYLKKVAELEIPEDILSNELSQIKPTEFVDDVNQLLLQNRFDNIIKDIPIDDDMGLGHIAEPYIKTKYGTKFMELKLDEGSENYYYLNEMGLLEYLILNTKYMLKNIEGIVHIVLLHESEPVDVQIKGTYFGTYIGGVYIFKNDRIFEPQIKPGQINHIIGLVKNMEGTRIALENFTCYIVYKPNHNYIYRRASKVNLIKQDTITEELGILMIYMNNIGFIYPNSIQLHKAIRLFKKS